MNIIYQKNGILQYKSDPAYFWHVIITKDGWIVGNGGKDKPYSAEKLEAYAKIMIERKNIMDEFLQKAYEIKSMYSRGHFFIKAPNGTYGLVIYIINEGVVRIEKGKLNPGEYIISPNDYMFYKKGNISDLKIIENFTYYSRYLAAIDKYASSGRTNIFTYNYITRDKTKYVDIFISNDDGSLANKVDNSHMFNDITIKGKYIFGEKVPIIMKSMFLDRYIISNSNERRYLKSYLNLILFIIGLLIY